MKYYVKERFDRPERMNTAGTKARSDVEEIASRMGYVPYEIVLAKEPDASDSLRVKWQQHLDVYKQWKSFEKQLCAGDKVLFQMPLMNNSIFLKGVLKKMRKKGVVTAAVIHDLEMLRLYRRKNAQGQALKSYIKTAMEEKQVLAQCNKVIVHNAKMKSFLAGEGIDSKNLIELGIFDYLTEAKGMTGRKKEKTVCIAGNLLPEKSKYIYALKDAGVTYRLYGPGFAEADGDRLCYMGCLPSNELPGKLDAAFGLVWDGPDIGTCSGAYGEYLRYNNPHKTSLYLAAGMPVIIWEQAALASFITDNRVGITVASLKEISGKIDALSEEEYEDMLRNAEEISGKIREGFYFTKALEQI